MIYLIDDNEKRQFDSGWDQAKFLLFQEFLTPIHRISEITDQVRDEMFKNENNVVLFHESFFEHFENKQNKDVNDIRNKFQNLTTRELNFHYVIFSGSNLERKMENSGKSASIPVHVLYNNLEVFIECYKKKNNYDLRILIYGENYEVEPQLLDFLNTAKKKFILENTNSNTILDDFFFFRSKSDINSLSKQFTTIFNKDLNNGFDQIIKENLNDINYKGIFIPLCFGNTLSDYNGLRLATEIRCTNIANQLTPIYIYSFVDLGFLLKNEYFNILKTKDVYLINYNLEDFQKAGETRNSNLKKHDLPVELKQLDLRHPKNYSDNHSVTNEWAIYQWSKAVGCYDSEELERVLKNVESNLFFKYLNTIFPPIEINEIGIDNLKLKFDLDKKPKILLIDDEAEKGWFEVFAHLLGDINDFHFDYLRVDFRSSAYDQIIDSALEIIFEEDFDIIILDFKLNPYRISENIKEETISQKLLRRIKSKNPGIQVIAFSASNNIQKIKDFQQEGILGFVSKGNPFRNDDSIIQNSLLSLMNYINHALHLNFLKGFYVDESEIIESLIPRRNVKNENPLPKEFVDESLKWLKLSNEILTSGYLNEIKIVSSFIFKFSVLENISTRIIDIENPIFTSKNEKGIKKYKFQFRTSEKRLRNFIEDEGNQGYYRKTNKIFESSRNLPWAIKILNAIDYITNESLSEIELTNIVKRRNDFIHANTTTGEKVNINMEDLLFINKIISIGLKNII